MAGTFHRTPLEVDQREVWLTHERYVSKEKSTHIGIVESSIFLLRIYFLRTLIKVTFTRLTTTAEPSVPRHPSSALSRIPACVLG